jgi:BirA family biotin operon repressor/biotin-[acetyl-CoA-carboxylase] ligase
MMNTLTFPILRLLADGRFHSGEAIAQHFDVTRTTVWSAIQEAQNLGVTVFSVRGRGYKLPDPIVMLDREAILRSIGPERAWFKLELHDAIESTNSYLMKKANQQGLTMAPHATCVVAELQTAGKGRRGRNWQAGLGASLTFSLLWRFQSGASALSGLSLAVGVARIRALHALGMQQTKLKWPNDVLVAHGQAPEKLAGILIELQGDMDGPSAAVIGVGVNLNLPEEIRRQIDQPATDVRSLAPAAANPNILLGTILKHMADVLSEFERGGFDVLRDEWSAHHAYHHQAVRLIMPDGREVLGEVSGVASDGILLVKTPQGEQRFSAGEISLRGAL